MERAQEVTDSSDPRIVYHYTTMDAMMKIVESAQIWTTSILYLNDITEQQYLIKHIRDHVVDYRVRHTVDDPHLFDWLFETPDKAITRHPFVASFHEITIHYRNGEAIVQIATVSRLIFQSIA